MVVGHDIRRTRLLDQLLDAGAQLWALEAGAGYGKSRLLAQLRVQADVVYVRPPSERSDPIGFVTALTEAAQMVGVDFSAPGPTASDLVAAFNPLSTIVIDDCHQWSNSVLALLRDVGNDPMLVARVVLSGRLTGMGGGPVPSPFHIIGNQQLALDPAETAELLVAHGIDDDDLATVLHQLSGGWPLAVSTAAKRMATNGEPDVVLRRFARQGSLVRDTSAMYLSALTPDDRLAASALAALPFFDRELADMVAAIPGLFDRLRVAGLPLNRRPDNWHEFAPSFRSSLLTEVAPTLRSDLVEYLVDKGEIHSAIDALLAAGERTQAAKLLAGLSRRQQARLDATQLHSAIASIGDAAAAAPRCLYVHAHVSAIRGHVAEGLESIERAERVFAEQDPDLADPAHVETLLTLGIWRTFDGDLRSAQSIADRCDAVIDLTTPNENRALLHDLRGVMHHNSASDEDLARAISELRTGLGLWRQLNQQEAATTTLFRLAGALGSCGRLAETLALLDQLPALGPMSLLTKGRLALERCWLLPFLGRANEVANEILEARRVAHLLDDSWLYTQSLIAEIVAASFDYQSELVKQLASKAIDEGYITFVNAPEAHFWVEVVEALSRCGLVSEAQQHLEAVTSTPGMLEWLRDYADASIEARQGDAATALTLLEALDLSDAVERQRRWQIAILRAYASWRLGQHHDAAKFLQVSFDEAAEISLPSLPLIAERRLVESIEAGTSLGGKSPAADICVFDEFQVRVDGHPASISAGHASTLLKFLVLHGR